MDDLLENEIFADGIAAGIHLHQRRVILAHERGEPLIIGDELFYFQTGNERLAELTDIICE